jgi:hypothetical protein
VEEELHTTLEDFVICAAVVEIGIVDEIAVNVVIMVMTQMTLLLVGAAILETTTPDKLMAGVAILETTTTDKLVVGMAIPEVAIITDKIIMGTIMIRLIAILVTALIIHARKRVVDVTITMATTTTILVTPDQAIITEEVITMVGEDQVLKVNNQGKI